LTDEEERKRFQGIKAKPPDEPQVDYKRKPPEEPKSEQKKASD